MIDIANDLDFYADESIEITKRIKDFREITLDESEFSKQFSVPVSKKNDAAFSYYANIDVDSTISPHAAIPAYWTIDLSTRFTGVLEIKGCVYENGRPKSYNLVFYGRAKNLATVFGQDTLQDIDWSDLDHTITNSNVVQSWVGSLLSGDVVYPLVDFESNWFFGPSSENIPGNISNQPNGILLGQLKPALRLQRMIEEIFSNYDLAISGTIDDTDIANIFLLPSSKSGNLIDYEVYDENLVQANASTSFLVETDGSDTVAKMDTEIQDDNDNYNTTNYTYTAPVAGSYTFRFWGAVTSAAVIQMETFIKVNGVEQQVGFDGTSDAPMSFDRTFQVSLLVGDEVAFYFREANSLTNTITVTSCNFKTIDYPTVESSYAFSFSNTMPDMKVVDFINGVLKTMRWVIVPDTKAGFWKMYSESDWREQGTTRDWSNYVDLKQITYNKPNIYKKLSLRFAESEAAIHSAFREIAGRGFGDLEARFEVDFGEEELLVESIFTTWPASISNVLNADNEVVGTTPITIYKMLDIEGSPVNDKFLMFYHNGDIAYSAYPYYIQTGVSASNDPVFGSISYYPVCQFHDGSLNPDNDSNSATYSIENPYLGEGPPLNNFFTKYWRDDILNLYANGARVASVKLYLPMDELLSFELNDTIWMEGRRWYIDEIVFNPLEKLQTAKLRSKNPKSNQVTIDEIGPGGKVTFSDSPDIFMKSLANVGDRKNGFYYQQTPKNIILNNKLTYTTAKSNITTNQDTILWGES